jgi:signal transduction histidine kinase
MPRPTTPIWVRPLLVVAAGALGTGMLVGGAQPGPLTAEMVLAVFVGWSFAACGIFIWARRPANRVGPLMTTVGMLWLLGRTMILIPLPITFTVGSWLSDLWAAAFAWFLLSFPTGRLAGRADAAIVGVFLFVSIPLEFVWLLFWVPANGLNALAIAPDVAAAHVVDTLQRVLISLGSVSLVLALGRRWLQSSGPVRRQMAPVFVGAIAILMQSASWILFTFGITIELIEDLALVAQIGIPIAILVVILRTRMARGAIADLVVELGQTPTPARLRDALANALGDTSLQVAYWAPAQNRFVDSAGDVVELPEDGTGRAVTMLERNGVTEAAIIHDAILLEDPGLIAAVASAMRLAVQNDRLTAEVEDQLAEVRASRARIVAAGDAERQRVERDLHDGAQQRLVSLSLALRLARTRLGESGDPDVRRMLDEAAAEARGALTELRDLARGIHPMVLTEAGLGPAVDSLVSRTSVGVSVDVDEGRFSAAVEGTAYFVVSEALANVAKYANATSATVRVRGLADQLRIEVDDDGIGGADPRAGTGLRGLADRLAAVGGTLTIDSPTGGGTHLVAEIPTQPASLPG